MNRKERRASKKDRSTPRSGAPLGALFARALARHQAGSLAEAEALYRQALALKPDLAEGHNNLGNALEAQGKLAEAVASYRRAAALRPSDAGMNYNLAAALLAAGEVRKALNVACDALKIAETPEIKSLIADGIKELRAGDEDPGLRDILRRALSEPWGRPQDLAPAATRLVKLSRPATLREASGNALFQALLENVAIADLELELLLTGFRSAILDMAASTAAIEPKILAVCAALARQCFVNEYLYDCSAAEVARAERLRDDLLAALRASAGVPPIWIAAVAAYFALDRVPGAELLLEREWPDPIAALLTQQLREPAKERSLLASIPCLTAIADRTSLEVQRQYEENPYPRWVKVSPPARTTTIDDFLAGHLPRAPFRPLARERDIEILVAGCGTGQHSIETARLFAGARILAIDLSRASLAYDKRQTEAAGLATIDYAQADILQLGSLGRSFDVIEASGVLHHLAEPMAGWRVLVSLLRPGGVMWVGLYSALARRDVGAARDFIAQSGLAGGADDIRRARRALIAAGGDAPFAAIAKTSDFFTISTCRDLLFHVEEHCLTIPDIAAFLTANHLTFLGFDIDKRVAARYRARFPADRSMTELGRWHEFESENPVTFRTMYQFWVQRAG